MVDSSSEVQVVHPSSQYFKLCLFFTFVPKCSSHNIRLWQEVLSCGCALPTARQRPRLYNSHDQSNATVRQTQDHNEFDFWTDSCAKYTSFSGYAAQGHLRLCHRNKQPQEPFRHPLFSRILETATDLPKSVPRESLILLQRSFNAIHKERHFAALDNTKAVTASVVGVFWGANLCTHRRQSYLAVTANVITANGVFFINNSCVRAFQSSSSRHARNRSCH